MTSDSEAFQEIASAMTGATAAIFEPTADTGTVVIVENEGNARLTTQIPPTHVALAGIDKLLKGPCIALRYPRHQHLVGLPCLVLRSSGPGMDPGRLRLVGWHAYASPRI